MERAWFFKRRMLEVMRSTALLPLKDRRALGFLKST
jgi:hypothetical protein